MYEDWKQLGKEYKESRIPIRNKIIELKNEKARLETSKYRRKKAEIEAIESKIIDIDDQLKLLNAMDRDLQEIGRESEHYFDRGWWRSEKYTLNSRHAKLPTIYYGFIEYECECEGWNQ
ncbi:hypothetical protein [Petroclostridium sp. X23]|uniref:hypothetical protein n=1 Tax=Petroclostridium sp. X23 TaxID=3045146 RepID=UPI0024ACA03A|nr:hypothetical protein [Petroclostridium sp. X23]WHH59151.1 hypothetical protein QKW49_25755 [Petroclostridium sp. X23]